MFPNVCNTQKKKWAFPNGSKTNEGKEMRLVKPTGIFYLSPKIWVFFILVVKIQHSI